MRSGSSALGATLVVAVWGTLPGCSDKVGVIAASGGVTFGTGGRASTGGAGSDSCERGLEQVATSARCPSRYCPGWHPEGSCDWLFGVVSRQCGESVLVSWGTGYVSGDCYYEQNQLVAATYFSDDSDCVLTAGTIPEATNCAWSDPCEPLGAAGMGGQGGFGGELAGCGE